MIQRRPPGVAFVVNRSMHQQREVVSACYRVSPHEFRGASHHSSTRSFNACKALTETQPSQQ